MHTAEVEPLVWTRNLDPAVRQRIREDAQLSRQELADGVGVSAVAIWRYETGQRRPSGDVGRRYCRLLYELALASRAKVAA